MLEYANAPHNRKHGPQGYSSYRHFKPWLRDEFCFRCAYCLSRERWFPTRHASFAVDHFEPKSLKPALSLDYDNLYYACQTCNTLKGDEALSATPCSTSLSQHLVLRPDGFLAGQTPTGQEYIDVLLLNRKPLVEMRQLLMLAVPAMFASSEPHHQHLMKLFCSFPDELPNLEEPPRPGSNSRPLGVKESYFVQRSEKRLPPFY